VLALFLCSFAPLLAMLATLRGAVPAARGRGRLTAVDWRALAAAVPPGMRMLVVATASYALMNLTLSLLVAAEAESTGRAHKVRLLSGHLLLLYLIPLVYFACIDGRTANQAGRRP
jgi:hypothetical protein